MKQCTSILLGIVASFLSLGGTYAQSSDDEAKIDAVIAKARARLGPEAKLRSVESIYMKGTLLYGDGNTGSAEIIFQKPLQQKFVGIVNDFQETSALDDTEGWRRVQKVGDSDAWSLDLYDVDEILHMQASVREALNFFDRPKTRRSKVFYLGEEEIKGAQCEVLEYNYGNGVWFRRYFDAETGRLVLSLNDKGVIFEESGEIIVDGIRFPKKLTTTFLTETGEQTMEISYSKIELNNKYDPEIFEIPSFE